MRKWLMTPIPVLVLSCSLAGVAAWLVTLAPVKAFAQQVVPGRNYFLAIDGTAARPSKSYERDTDTGQNLIGPNNEGNNANGILQWDWNASRMKLRAGYTLDFDATSISEADIAKLDGVTCGAVTASKVLCVDANKDLSGVRHFAITGGIGVGTSTSTNGRIVASEQIIAGSAITAGDNYQAPAGANYFFLGRSRINALGGDGRISFTPNTAANGSLTEQFTNNPTCATNCGTSPTLSGVDSSFTLTMGASGTPASGFIVTFNGTWAAAPQCTVSMGLSGMAVGKLPLTVVTTTTTATVVTNGAAPANSDVYHFRCSLGQ
jgi:hypothetical protein